jgi:hypothetical protein
MFTPTFKIAPYRIMRAIALGLSTGYQSQIILIPINIFIISLKPNLSKRLGKFSPALKTN